MKDLISLILLFLLSFPSLVSSSSTPYSLPTAHFINCGSPDSVDASSRLFVGDYKDSAASFMKKGVSSPVTTSNSSTPAGLYRTARIFTASNSSYTFKVHSPGSGHFLRFHFSAFVSAEDARDLSHAVFDVSVQGLTLLSNFSVNDSSVTVKEFLLTVNGKGSRVEFNPVGSSFAFVNAIEFFPVPDGLTPNTPTGIPVVGQQGQSGNFTALGPEVFAEKYRLNVGGETVEPDTDTLWRQWKNDSEYLAQPAASNTIDSSSITYLYDITDVDNYIGPEAVYRTARYFNYNNGIYSNNSWLFQLVPNSSYVVRFHFCDIMQQGLNTILFNLYVFDHYNMSIDTHSINLTQTAVPFKQDLVVKSAQDGFIRFSLGNESGSALPIAYLNGLEIMEMIGSWDWNSGASMGQQRHTVMIIGITLGCAVVLFLLVLIATVLSRKYKRQKPADTVSVWSAIPAFVGLGSTHGNKSSEPSICTSSPVPHLHLGLRISLSEILHATNNFDSKLMVGRGGFGNVYKGTLKNGTRVAVKRSEPGSSQGLLEFQTEIIVLSKIRHRHLVSLIGYCAERSEMILVYEFMEEGTLRDHLYNTDLPALAWKQRLEICIGAARGLHYLHKGAAGGIIHRDVKSTNILLDSNFVAKVADFGLSKLGSSLMDESQASTGLKGTFGYLDPEYLKTQQMTEKSDVYAFGVVLLEVLCARPPIDTSLPREQMNLAEWGITNYHNGTLDKIVDPLVAGEINQNSLRKFGETTEKCLKEDDTERPIMGDVLWDLEYALQLQKSPVPREVNEDSTTGGSSLLGFSGARRLPSFSMSFGADDSLVVVEEDDRESSNSKDSNIV